ncbi:MAG TPA: serine/threonine-protein kinase [Thermoanaerobaculia bacterium]|nr:serine/threonine-protein kinase [Thermoanaerobaculia bacterium]
MPTERTQDGELRAGQLVAGRYRIVNRLGAGAMGEVYEAEDQELGTAVALKLLHRESTMREEVAARFRREVLLARRVTHPNVCRIFDLGVHRDERTGTEHLFLSMELVRGETLADRIAARGALDPGEVVPLARQLAAALDAAHAAGVVHRDLKCANVLLEEGPGGTRVVVTDFGLARALEPEEFSPDGLILTAVGGVVGTPAYMSPEQLTGGEVGPASDLYSFGIVLYEMVTGELPFTGTTPLSAAVRRLHEEPPRPSLLREGLDRRWERVILRCLTREPGARFPSASDVVRALEGEAIPGRSPVRPGWLRALLALAFAGLLAGVWWAGRYLRPRAEPAVAERMEVRETVAVLGFRNLSDRPEAAWLANALTEMLTTEAAAGGRWRVVAGESVARARRDLRLDRLDALGPENLARIRDLLGADVVVLGGFSALGPGSGDRLRLDLRLQSTRGGEAAFFGVEGTEGELFDLVGRSGSRLRELLGAGALTPAEEEARQAALPHSAAAARFYAEGLAALRLREAVKAREQLVRVVEIEPGFAPARAALARALAELGYQNAAVAAAEQAVAAASGLAREETLAIEGTLRELSGQWPAAVETYRALATLRPDDLDVGLRLAEAQREAGDPTAALATIATLRELPPPAGADPRLDLAAADAYAGLGQHAERLEAALAAGRRARELGATVMLADARLKEGAARRRVGERELAPAALEESRRLYLQAGDRVSAANVLIELAGLRRQEGDLPGAAMLFREALATYDLAGNRRRAARARFSLSLLLADAGRIEEAEAGYREALAVFREAGDRQAAVATLANIGTMRFFRGDLAAAIAHHEEALGLAREIGNRSRELVSLLNLAEAHLEAGDPAAARSEAVAAIALAEAGGDRQAEGRGRWGLCGIEIAAAAWEAAATECERAHELLSAEQEVASVAGVEITLARLALARGETASAVTRARSASGRLADGEYAGDAALAAATLAETLLARGETDAAGRTLAEARRLLVGSDELRPRLAIDRTAALLAAAVGDRDTARRRWERLGAEGREYGMAILTLEAGIEGAALDGAAGRNRLRRLGAEARERGLLELAGRAERLAVAPSGR